MNLTIRGFKYNKRMLPLCMRWPTYLHSPWTVTFLVAFTVDGGVSVVDWQVYCPPWDVCRGLNERVRVVVEPVVL